MQVATLIERLQVEGEALARAAERAAWDAPLPACPGWTVRDLVVHTGGVHRWAADIVRHARDGFDTEVGDAVGEGPPEDQLLDWYLVGLAALVATLRAAPADLDCATFLPAGSPLEFWSRRQAHETAVHRADAESAAGPITAVDDEFAADGMAEVLAGFGARRRRFERPGTSMLLEPAGTAAWTVEFGEQRVTATRGRAGAADATVAGTASDIYLWLWNRPSDAAVTGDADVAEQWRRVRVGWS